MSDSITRRYTERLGTLTRGQLQAALDRFDLGELVDAEPLDQGLFGQNIALRSARGAWVLRGRPHYEGQLEKERFFARLIHERTDVPGPWPYRIEKSPGIFGWSFAIMPRLSGLQIGREDVRKSHDPESAADLARAMGCALGRLHDIRWSHPGTYDLASDSIVPHELPHARRILTHMRENLETARAASAATTDACVDWVEEVIARGSPALDEPFDPTYVHHDFTEGNTVAKRESGHWRVAGVFDLMEGYFGDPEEDLMRTLADYAAWGSERVRGFVAAYRARQQLRAGFAERLPVYMLADRLGIWSYGQVNKVWFPANVRLRQFAEFFTKIRIPD